MRPRVTLKDIADEAGVSVMTVSNSLNGRRGRVSATVVRRIEEIARARGYVANASARSLAASASHLIGLLVLTEAAATLSLSPYSVAVFSVIERELRDRDYHVLLRGVSSVDEADVALRTWNLDGAVILGFPDHLAEQLATRTSAPILALDSYAAEDEVLEVRSKDREGGFLATDHLLGLGHRRILFAAPGFADTGVVHERFAGFTAAHAAHGVTWDERDRAVAEATFDAGLLIGTRLRSLHPAVTAVFATADLLAIGVMEGARSTGTELPRDLSVVGYDNLEVARYVTPQLTSIDQDVPAKGARAAQRLLTAIEGDEPARVPEHVEDIAVRLVRRSSVVGPR